MKKILYLVPSLFLLISCSESSNEIVPITSLFPLTDGSNWTYQYNIDGEDTVDVQASFSVSQLSDNSKRTVIELTSDLQNVVLVLEGQDDGICIDHSSQNYENVLQNINSYDTGQCTAFLKYPIDDGDQYTFSNTVNDKNYTYNVEVFEEVVSINGTSYDTYNYVIPSGREPELFATEVFFNPEKGIVKLVPEAGDRELILVDTNF